MRPRYILRGEVCARGDGRFFARVVSRRESLAVRMLEVEGNFVGDFFKRPSSWRRILYFFHNVEVGVILRDYRVT